MSAKDVSEFPRPLIIADVPSRGRWLRLEATAEECGALAQRLGVERVVSLAAELQVKPWRKRGLSVQGSFDATVEQNCVVTLEPVVHNLAGEFTSYFTQDIELETFDVDAGSDGDEPEIIDGHTIDLGELVVEHVILEVDPYPRHPEAPIGGDDTRGDAMDDDEPPPGPFAVLETLRPKTSDDG